MTEEDYFRKNYPDSCYGDKPLSPHWDFFQEGVEFGERESEEKIAKLERKIASIRGSHRVDLAKLNARVEQVERLKKENAELKILVSSILYEINALWDISEMNEDVRKHAERIDSEVIK